MPGIKPGAAGSGSPANHCAMLPFPLGYLLCNPVFHKEAEIFWNLEQGTKFQSCWVSAGATRRLLVSQKVRWGILKWENSCDLIVDEFRSAKVLQIFYCTLTVDTEDATANCDLFPKLIITLSMIMCECCTLTFFKDYPGQEVNLGSLCFR